MKRGPFNIGCILDHGCRNDKELSADIIHFAKSHGFDPPTSDYNYDLYDESIDAIEWLNEQEKPPFTHFYNNHEAGAFGLWPLDEPILEGQFDILVVQDLPSYVAHINDHGNMTLYEVTLKEVWDIV